MGMTQEQAAAAIHAAKLAQINAMGRSLDKMPSGFLHPQLDISKIHNSQNQDLHKSLTMPSVTIEPANNSSQRMSGSSSSGGLEIRRTPENMDMRSDNSPSLMNINNNNSSNNNKNNNFNSYNSKEESSADERQDMSDDESIAVN